MISLETQIDEERGKVRLFVRMWDGYDTPDYYTIDDYTPDQLDRFADNLKAEASKCRHHETILHLNSRKKDIEAELVEIDETLNKIENGVALGGDE